MAGNDNGIGNRIQPVLHAEAGACHRVVSFVHETSPRVIWVAPQGRSPACEIVQVNRRRERSHPGEHGAAPSLNVEPVDAPSKGLLVLLAERIGYS